MVRYWLCVTNEENWRVVKKRLVWGVSGRYRAKMESVEIGDFLIFYVKPLRIGGIFVAASEPFTSTEKVFSSEGFSEKEVFPYRVRLKPLIVPDKPVDFKPLIPKLKFITNKEMWTGHLRGAMRTIPEEDFNLIKETIMGG